MSVKSEPFGSNPAPDSLPWPEPVNIPAEFSAPPLPVDTVPQSQGVFAAGFGRALSDSP